MSLPAGRRFTGLVLVLLAVGIALSYANSFAIGYELDDNYVIRLNPAIRSLGNIPRFFVDPFALTSIHDNADLRPVLVTTYALNYAISGLEPWSYHLLSVLIHFVAAVLVFRIVRDFLWWPASERGSAGVARFPAAAAALFFALAPLNSQPVVYMSARSALLATTLYLGAFLASLHRRWITMGVLHALALLTKAIAVTLPVTILLYDFLYRDRARHPSVRAYLRDWRRLVLPVLVPAAIDVVYLAYRHTLLPPWVREVSHLAFVTPWIWFMSEWWALLEYVRLFLWPDALSVDHESVYVLSPFETRGWLPLVVILAWIAVALRWSARQPMVAFATFWFFVTLTPESSFAALSEVTNDHRPYIATSLGLSVLLAWVLYTLAARLGRLATPVFASACAALCVAAIPANRHRNWVWQDTARLWQSAVETGPRNARAWMNAGKALMGVGRYSDARRYFDRARELAPNYSYVYLNLSALERLEGNPQAALLHAEHAVRIAPDFSMAHYHHGSALEHLGRTDEAAAAYRRAIEINPNEIEASDALARLLVAHADTPDMKAGLEALGVANQPELAAVHFRRILERNPAHYGATYQLATALDRAGKASEAEPLWEKMLAMAEAANDAATLETVRARLAGMPDVIADGMKAGLEALYQRNDPDAAVVFFRHVLQRNPEHYGATFQLARSLDRAGRRDEAQPLWEKMRVMAEAAGDQETIEQVRARLAGRS